MKQLKTIKKAKPSATVANAPVKQALSFPWYIIFMPTIVAICSILYFEFGEVIALNNGCGWDGVTYKNVVWSLQWNKSTTELQERSRLRIDPYRAQRIAPSVAVYAEMQLARYIYRQITPMFERLPSWLEWSYEQYPLPPWFFRWFAKSDAPSGQSVTLTIDSFVAGYFVFHNFAMLLGVAFLWALTAQRLELSVAARWLGFAILFINVAVMKMSFYYPTLTDTTALFIGMLTLYGYVSRWSWLLLPTAAIGFFTFPTAFFVAIILFILPRSNTKEPFKQNTQIAEIDKRRARLIAGIASGTLIIVSVYLVFIAEIRFPEVEDIIGALAPLAIILMAAQFFFVIQHILLVLPIPSFLAALRSQFAVVSIIWRALCALTLWGALWYAKTLIADPTIAAPMNTNLFLGGSIACAISKPLLAIVALAVYFGPAMLLIILHFRCFLHNALRLDLGFFVVLVSAVLLATIMTETRQLINFFPFLALGIVLLFEKDLFVSPRRIYGIVSIVLLSLAFSKIWLPFNFPDMQEQAANIQHGSFTSFPLQYYFMNHGPWMSMTSYLIQACALIACVGVFWWAFTTEKEVKERQV